MTSLSELENSQSVTASTAYRESPFLPPTAASRRSRFLLGFTIDALLKRHGITRVLFVTLTFERGVRSAKAAHEKLNSLLNAVRRRYGGYLWVLEPHASGCIHYHLLVPVDFDCHAGTDLDAWRDKSLPGDNSCFRFGPLVRGVPCTRDTYLHRSMNAELQAEDDWWQATANTHGFGRVQVAPIYGGADAIRKYLVKEDWRSRPWPFKERKHVRFWSCSRNLSAGTAKFSWNTPNARQGRQRLAAWARERGCESVDDLRCVYGSRWGYLYYCEMVWGVKPKRAPEPSPPAACPFPRPPRYNDPTVCWPRSPDGSSTPT